MDEHMTIDELIARRNVINVRDLWWDWFCSEKALVNRGKNLLTKLIGIADSKKFDKHKCYVFFKNNCPVAGRLYDDFRICDIETGDVIYTVVPSSGFDCFKGKAQVYGRENDFMAPLAEGTWKDIKKWFLSC